MRLFFRAGLSGFLVLAFFYYFAVFKQNNTLNIRKYFSQPQPVEIHTKYGSSKLHLIIPATNTNTLFCKVLATAHINDYPAPLLINFGQTFVEEKAAHAAKLNGLDATLTNMAGTKTTRALKPEGDVADGKELMLIIDGFDAWFQLGPEVLVERYLELAKAEKPTVLFGADKECWPNKADTPACTNIPQSPLPTDAYGPETDKDKWHYKSRPRFLNSGTILGNLNEVQEVFSVAKVDLDKLEAAGKVVRSDQGIIADIFGERRTDATIALDYWSQFFQTLTHSHNDIEWKKITGKNMLKNIITQKIPPVIHFNGPKHYLTDWWPRMWFFNMPGGLETMMKKRNGAWVPKTIEHKSWSWKSWDELCGDYEEIFDLTKSAQSAQSAKSG